MPKLQKISHEQIELRAYELYVERAGAEGDAVEDWLRAEKELGQKVDPELIPKESTLVKTRSTGN